MDKAELMRFIKYSHKWRKGADVPMPQPSDISIAERAVLHILEHCVSNSDNAISEALKGFKFNHFGYDRDKQNY